MRPQTKHIAIKYHHFRNKVDWLRSDPDQTRKYRKPNRRHIYQGIASGRFRANPNDVTWLVTHTEYLVIASEGVSVVQYNVYARPSTVGPARLNCR
jgi:hypothetical protein